VTSAGSRPAANSSPTWGWIPRFASPGQSRHGPATSQSKARHKPGGALVEATHSVVRQPGPLHAFHQRLRARRGYSIASVAAARKLASLFWCLLTRDENYAHAQPSLTAKKIRRLELMAGAKRYERSANGVYSTNEVMREAERQLAQQAEASYVRMVRDWQATAPAKKAGASATPEHA
jgi:transposase